MDLIEFAEAVGMVDPVTIAGRSTRGGALQGVRSVAAPSGILEFEPAEMTVRCGAGTPVDDLLLALGEAGQTVALPEGGTVGGALAVGRSDVWRLGRGPVRDTLLQARYVSAEGRVVKAGGPTVKNVSGFDLGRLLVGSRGTLGFLAEVILRTRPKAETVRWFTTPSADPFQLLGSIYKPSSILWDGSRTWVCLEGHAGDVSKQSERIPGVTEVPGPPPLPTGSRRSLAPSTLRGLVGSFVAEVGVGIVHHADPVADPVPPSAEVAELHRRIKRQFDPTNRMNPGVDVLNGGGTR